MADTKKSIKNLFFKAKPEETKVNNVPVGGGGPLSPISSPNSSNFSQSNFSQPIAVDNNLIETFVQKLQELINQNNQPGFDFLEFTETLFEESQSPDSEVYKTVFRIAKKMDKSLTPEKLIQSANFYKNLVQQSADGEILKGQNKKNALEREKDNEKKSLEKAQIDANSQIEKLNAQILELQSQSNNANNQLSAIEQKYQTQFSDIDIKIDTIANAKTQVLNSISDVESGITNNLK